MSAPPQTFAEPTLASLLDARARTDSLIPGEWLSLPIASYAVWAVIPVILILGTGLFSTNFLTQFGILATVGLLSSAASSYLVFVLVNRRNTHFSREQALLWKTVATVKSRTLENDLKTRIPLSSAEHTFASLVQSSGERSAVLSSLLALIPYLGWAVTLYVLAFLSEDFKRHEVREDLVLQDLDRSLRAVGLDGIPPRTRHSPRRNPVIVLLAPFASLALFTVYLAYQAIPLLLASIIFPVIFLPLLFYQAIRDPVVHFEYHRQFENSLTRINPEGYQPMGGSL